LARSEAEISTKCFLPQIPLNLQIFVVLFCLLSVEIAQIVPWGLLERLERLEQRQCVEPSEWLSFMAFLCEFFGRIKIRGFARLAIFFKFVLNKFKIGSWLNTVC
jgi:hypothetical protein